MFFKPVTWLVALVLLCLQVAGGGLPGCIERVYLWYAYELAIEYKGIDQKWIYPDWNKYKSLGATRDPPPSVDIGGDDPKKKGKVFTFNELLANLDGKPCNVAPPSDTRDTLTVAKELQTNGFDADFKPISVNRGLVSTQAQEAKKKKIAKRPLYLLLHEMIADMIKEIDKDPDFVKNAKVLDRIEKCKNALTMIESIREADFHKYLKGDLSRTRGATKPNPVAGRDPLPDPGLGMQGDDIVTNPVKNEFDGITYDEIDLDETIKKMKARGASDEFISDFKQYAETYGKKGLVYSTGESIRFTEAAMTHFETLEMVKAVKTTVHACNAGGG